MLTNCRFVVCRLSLVVVIMAISHSLASQSILSKQLNFKAMNSSIPSALLQLSEEANFPIIFSSKLLNSDRRVSIDLQQKSIQEILAILLEDSRVSFKESKGKLILFKTPPKRIILSGYVQDAKTGEGLVLANVWETGSGRGVSTNDYGFFSLRLEEGPVELHFSYLGYEQLVKIFDLSSPQRLVIKLEPSLTLREVVVVDDRNSSSYRQYLPGRGIGINADEIEDMPTLVGESDLFRLLQ